jgi:hypothetical protein
MEIYIFATSRIVAVFEYAALLGSILHYQDISDRLAVTPLVSSVNLAERLWHDIKSSCGVHWVEIGYFILEPLTYMAATFNNNASRFFGLRRLTSLNLVLVRPLQDCDEDQNQYDGRVPA